MDFFSKVGELYTAMWKAIIRPGRDYYDISQMGPTEFMLRGNRYKRRDFELTNARNLRIQCSHFEPTNRDGSYKVRPYPCVIYLHGNSSSRLECVQCGSLGTLLPLGVSVLCFDFAGSGLSEGDYVTLGFFERADVAVIVDHLRRLGRITTIGLWGRSMGAVTACLVAAQDPSIACIVADSAFTSLKSLAEELAGDFLGWQPPRWFLSMALGMVRNTVQQKAAFDLYQLNPLEDVARAFMPALFIAARDDTFIRPHHSQELHEAYAGDKNIVLTDGTHNTPRSDFLHQSVALFFERALAVPGEAVLLPEERPRLVWAEVAMDMAAREQERRRHIISSCRVSETSESGRDSSAGHTTGFGEDTGPDFPLHSDQKGHNGSDVDCNSVQTLYDLEQLLEEFEMNEFLSQQAAQRSPPSPPPPPSSANEASTSSGGVSADNPVLNMVAPHRASRQHPRQPTG